MGVMQGVARVTPYASAESDLFEYILRVSLTSVGIDLKELGRGSDVKMFENLYRD